MSQFHWIINPWLHPVERTTMASMLTSPSLLLLALAAGCYCAPSRIAGGFIIGGRSDLDLVFGGKGEIKRDGLALSGDGNGAFGGGWKGTGYAGGYGAVNNHYVGGRVSGTAVLRHVVKPRLSAAFGYNSKQRIPIAFQPAVVIEHEADLAGNGELANGDDARRLAELYGDTVVLNEENTPKIA